MKKYIALLGCLVALFGCGSSSPQPVIKVTEPTIKDPNAGYTVVGLGIWQFQVPDTFIKETKPSGNVSYWSPDKLVVVTSTTFVYDGSITDLIKKQALLNEEALNLKPLGIDHLTLDDATWALLVSKNDTIFSGNLLFVENGQAYAVTCAGYMANVKKSVHMCEKVFKSVKRVSK